MIPLERGGVCPGCGTGFVWRVPSIESDRPEPIPADRLEPAP